MTGYYPPRCCARTRATRRAAARAPQNRA